MDYIRAFLVGGMICLLVQILMDNTKLMPGRIMVLLVVSGSVLGFLGLYEPFAQWAGAGATAVSYTHLDVYKRQQLYRFTPTWTPARLQMNLFSLLLPVSYTHLDVYKRQLL